MITGDYVKTAIAIARNIGILLPSDNTDDLGDPESLGNSRGELTFMGWYSRGFWYETLLEVCRVLPKDVMVARRLAGSTFGLSEDVAHTSGETSYFESSLALFSAPPEVPGV